MLPRPRIARIGRRILRCLPAIVAALALMACCIPAAPPPAAQQQNAPAKQQSKPVAELSPKKGKSAPNADRWEDVEQAAQVGDVRVEANLALNHWVQVNNFGQWVFPKATVIQMTLINRSKTKVVRFNGWQGNATMADEHGNTYKPMNLDMAPGFSGFGDLPWDPQAEFRGYPIIARDFNLHPGKDYVTHLFFEQAADVAKEVRLTLPATELGGTGAIRLRVPLKREDNAKK